MAYSNNINLDPSKMHERFKKDPRVEVKKDPRVEVLEELAQLEKIKPGRVLNRSQTNPNPAEMHKRFEDTGLPRSGKYDSSVDDSSIWDRLKRWGQSEPGSEQFMIPEDGSDVVVPPLAPEVVAPPTPTEYATNFQPYKGMGPPPVEESIPPEVAMQSQPDAIQGLRDYYAMRSEGRPDVGGFDPAIENQRTKSVMMMNLAAGMLKGAGGSWAGVGEGFAGAARSAEAGFNRYNRALNVKQVADAKRYDSDTDFELGVRKLEHSQSTARRNAEIAAEKEAYNRARDARKDRSDMIKNMNDLFPDDSYTSDANEFTEIRKRLLKEQMKRAGIPLESIDLTK